MIKFFVWHPDRMWAVSAVFAAIFLAALVAKSRYPRIRCLPPFIIVATMGLKPSPSGEAF